MKITAIILTYNEAHRIAPCLQSISWVDDILVVDGFSTDGTQQLARDHGAKVIESDLLGPKNPGGYAAQRAFALDQAKADWVLFLDADERCTPELSQEIRTTVEDAKDDDVAAYQVRRKEFYWGVHTEFTHGSGWLVRLVRPGGARWSDRLVHEGLETSGSIRQLQGKLLHYSKDSIHDYLATQNRYTSLEAQELEKCHKPLGRHPLLDSFRTFCNIYIYKGAYREGAFGLVMSVFFASYTFQTWAKYWESELKSGRLTAPNPRFRPLEILAAFLHHAWTTLRPPRN